MFYVPLSQCVFNILHGLHYTPFLNQSASEPQHIVAGRDINLFDKGWLALIRIACSGRVFRRATPRRNCCRTSGAVWPLSAGLRPSVSSLSRSQRQNQSKRERNSTKGRMLGGICDMKTFLLVPHQTLHAELWVITPSCHSALAGAAGGTTCTSEAEDLDLVK